MSTEAVRVYHGTSARHEDSIADGLRAVDTIGPFVTTDQQRAAGYAVRAVCCDLHEDSGAATLATVVVLDVAAAGLVEDQSEPGDFLLLRGAPSAAIQHVIRFDADPYIGPGDPELYAELAERARAGAGLEGRSVGR